MDFFQTLAECSVAFAGFAAIHAALRGGNSGRILHRSFTVVLTGALAFLLSLLVLLLEEIGLSSTVLWRVASGIGVVPIGYGAYLFYRSHMDLSRLGDGAQAPITFAIAALLLLLAVPVLVFNVGGWWWTPGPAAYGAALTMLLTSGVVALLGSFWFPLAIAIQNAKLPAPPTPDE